MLRRLFRDPTDRLRTAWRFLIFGFGFLTIFGAAQIGVGIGFVIYLELAGDGARRASETQLDKLVEEYTPILSAIAAPPMTIAIVLLVVVCRKYLDRRTVGSLGLSSPDATALAWLPLSFLLGMAPILLAAFCLWGLGEYRFGPWSGSAMSALMAVTLIPMAFVEEIVARGYLLQNLVDIRRTLFGVLFSSVVFWLFHCLNPNAWSSPWISINLFGAGIVLALAYLASGNLWFPTVMHYAWNFTQGVLLSLPISGIETPGLIEVERTGQAPDWLSGGKFGLEGSVLVTGVEVVLAGLLGYALVLKRRCEAELTTCEVVEESTRQDEDASNPYKPLS